MATPRSMKSQIGLPLAILLLACAVSYAQDPNAAGGSVERPADPMTVVKACPACGGQPASTAAKAPGRTTCCCGHVVDWSKVPFSIRPMARPGHFYAPPAGPAYFSLTDQLTDTCREAMPKSGYGPFALMPPSFFDADFRYVDGVPQAERTLVEELKRIPCGDCLLFSTGGNAWARFMNEHNSRLTEADNSYTLARTRAFGDLSFGDMARVFGEYIWADSFSEELSPLPIDVNRGDILNLFLDLNLVEFQGSPVVLRLGRQELLFGSQRLVSTLDWANTRRTFEGARVMRRGEKWDFDAFFVQFVPALPSEFDRPDEDQDFAGAWLTYRPQKGRFLDLYYLYLDNSNNVVQQGIERAPFEAHTFGSRWAGDYEGYLWDTELTMQLGDRGPADLVAGAATAGLGRKFKNAPFSPAVWLYYDYASGDADPNAGDYNTFNQLYPFGHFYLGWLDLVGRQNIHDANAHLVLHPNHWITVLAQYHHFWLNHRQDALYNVGGIAIRRDPTGAAGNNVGDEVDLIVNFHLGRYSDIMVGYSKLYGGGFLEQTSGNGLADDAELLHLMFQQKW